MSVPMLATAALGLTMLISASKPANRAVRSAHSGQTPGGHSMDRPTGPSQMWVDRPINTVLRNDARGGNFEAINAYIRDTYATEAASHPGVRLVAGQAVA